MSGGPLDASVTLAEVLTIVGSKRVPLAPELAGYLVLEVAEHADPNGGDVDPKSIFVSEEGTVALVRPKRDAPRGDAEASIRTVLGRLLAASGSQTPALAATSKRKNGAGLSALVEEIEAALIPVNRAAGRRALARLAREVKRVTLGVGRHTLPSSSSARGNSEPPPPPPKLPSVPSFSSDEDPTAARSRVQVVPEERIPSVPDGDVDALISQFGVSGDNESHRRDLKKIAGVDPTPAPPGTARQRNDDRARPAGVEPFEADVDALLDMNSDSPEPPATKASRPAARIHPGLNDARKLPSQPSQLSSGARSRSVREGDGARATLPSAVISSSGWGWGFVVVLSVATIIAGSYAMWRFRQSANGPSASAAQSTPGPASIDLPTACLGTLIVSDVPTNAEVLVHEGQAPVEVVRMPVGARLEFVATAEGYTPKRVVIPAGIGWDTGPDGNPRYEAAVQLDLSRTRGLGDPWPAGEPGSAVGGEGPPGTVRVVATPRGAEIWMLAGIGPGARIDHLRCDRDMDLLMAGPGTYRKRIHVAATDFVSDDTSRGSRQNVMTRVARVSVGGH